MNFIRSTLAKRAAVAIVATFAAASAAVAAQSNSLAGTWNYVPDRSKFATGESPYKSMTLTFSDSGAPKMMLDGVDSDGKPVKGTFNVVVDGKPHPIEGINDYDAVSLTRFSDTISSYTYTKRKSVVVLGNRVLSADGHTLTFAQKTYNANGKEIANSQLVFARPGFEVASAEPPRQTRSAPAGTLVSPLSADETAAAAALEKGNDDEAIRLFTNIIDTDKTSPMLYYDHNSRGIAYAKKNQNELAIADFDAALKLKPDYTDARFRRGGTRLQLKQYDAAIQDLSAVVQADANNAMAYRLRGFAYNTLGNDKAAAEDYEKACTLDKALCQN